MLRADGTDAAPLANAATPRFSTRLRRALTWAVPALALGSLIVPGCIDSKCYTNDHCADGKVCQATTGACVEPECVTTSTCPEGQICEQSACVVGCLEEQDCDDGLRCIDNRCRALDEECQCPLAPLYCLDDLNPSSPTSGQEVCVPNDSPGGTLLFFGSVYCSHCTGLFATLLMYRNMLRSEGLDPRLVFVQLKDAPANPMGVAENLPGVTAEVIQDAEFIDIWEAYQANWYHVVVLDTHGCVSAHLGPLFSGGMDGEQGQAVQDAWRKSMSPECPDLPEEPDPPDGGTKIPF